MDDVEIKKLAKPDLIRALKTVISHISQESKFDQILNELRTLKDEKNSMLTDIKNLKDENEKCHKILAQHQKVLESIDADRRATNIIISGVAEEDPLSDNGNVANNDVEKVSLILSKIGAQEVQVERVDRLGKQNTTGSKRLLKVQLKKREDRGKVLEKSKTLKDAQDSFRNIYIKKDVSPSVRNEYRRLREVVDREKNRPENAGKHIYFNARERKVYVDNLEVDCYKPNFF